MDEQILEAIKKAMEERIASLSKDRNQLDEELSTRRLSANELNEFGKDLEKINKELEQVEKEKEEIANLKEEKDKLDSELKVKSTRLKERREALQKDKKQLEEELDKGSKLNDNEKNEYIKDLDKVNNELESLNVSVKEIIQLKKRISKDNLRIDEFIKKYNIDKEKLKETASIDKDEKKTIKEPREEVDYERAKRFKELLKSGMTQEAAKEQLDKELPFDRKSTNKSNKDVNKSEKDGIDFEKLNSKYNQNLVDIEKLSKLIEKYKGDKLKIDTLTNEKEKLEKENDKIVKQFNDNNKYKLSTIPEKEKNESNKQEETNTLKKDEEEEKRNKVIFNIRTGEYTYFGKDGKQYKLSLKSKYLKGSSKEDILNEILDNHEIDPMDPKDIDKIDIHLYQMLKYIDSKEHTSKADDYIEAFLDEDYKNMPIDLVYDLKNKSKDNEEVKKLKFVDRMRIKSIARRHEKLGLAECIKDKTLFKKILLGLGIAGASTAIAIGAGNTANKDEEKLVNMEVTENDDKDIATPTPAEDLVEVLEQSGKEVDQNTNEKPDNEPKTNVSEQKNDKLAKQLKEFMSQFKGTNYVSVNEGLEYTNASDMNQVKGKFVEDMDCKISNRAIVQKLEDGSEKIIATAKGKTWEEAGIDISKYNSPNYIEKYALEAIGGRKDSRGYSIFGWVDSKDCEKLYEFTREENGRTVTTYHTKESIKDMAVEKFSLTKYTARNLTSDSKATDSKTVEDEQER